MGSATRRVLGTLWIMAMLTSGWGCTTPPDFHSRMARAVAPGPGLQQTQLAHLGHVDTADGRFEVAYQSLNVTGMLAPRGQARLLLLTSRGELVRVYQNPSRAHPLWCEGGRVYLSGFGFFDSIPFDPEFADRFGPGSPAGEFPTGNVIDFSGGLRHVFITREKRYGSSGGSEDEVWPAR